jgi:hypothetical protein
MDYNNHLTGMQSFSQLDAEFDQHLANMKKYVLELQDKKGKRVLWNIFSGSIS